jgi:hypothetical protein
MTEANNANGIKTNIYLSSSINNANGNNRGRKAASCGKLGQKSGKLGGKACGKLSSTQKRADHADQIADWLSSQLDAPYCRAYFCKCAYYLPYEQIVASLTAAKMPTVKSPVKYFNAVTKRLLLNRQSN